MSTRPGFTCNATDIEASLGLGPQGERAARDARRCAAAPAYPEAFPDEAAGTPGGGRIPPEPGVLSDAR